MSHHPDLQPLQGEYAICVVFIRNRQEDLNCGVRERYKGMGLSDDELLGLQLRDELREAYEQCNIAGRFVVKALTKPETLAKIKEAEPANAAVAEWVGMHYGKNFDAMNEQERRYWVLRYIQSHKEA